MKRFFALVVALMAITAVSAFAESGADNSLQAILDNGRFVIGLDVGFPPMGFVDADTGEIVGFDIDLAREVAKRLGVELVTQPINWDAKEMELNAHHIDAIWNGMTITPARFETMSFSMPYMKNVQVVVVRESDGITDLADLAGKKLGIQAGSSANDALDAAADFKASLGEVVPFDDNLVALMDLNQGGLDAVLLDVIVATYNMTVNEYPFIVLEESLAQEEFGIGFRKGDIALRDKVDATLLEMAADGTVKAISEKWFGADITTIAQQTQP